MKKPYKVLSTAALVGVVSASAFVSAAAAEEVTQTTTTTGFVFEANGEKLVVDIDTLVEIITSTTNPIRELIYENEELRVPHGFQDSNKRFITLDSFIVASSNNPGKSVSEVIDLVEDVVSEEEAKTFKKPVVSDTGEVELAPIELDEEPVELVVESTTAIDATTIEVTFDNGDVVEVELTEALVHGDNEVTFEVDGVEYTVTVNYVDEVLAAVEAVNEATSATATRNALTANEEVLGLDLTDFNKFSALLRLEIAGVVLEEKPSAGYDTVEAIQEVFNAEVLDEVMTTVAGANSDVKMKSAVERYYTTLGLDLSAYNALEVFETGEVDTDPEGEEFNVVVNPQAEVAGVLSTQKATFVDDADLEAEGAKTALEKIQDLFTDEVAEWTALAVINGATEDTILDVLTEDTLKDLGVANATVTNFGNLTIDGQVRVAYSVLEGPTYDKFADAGKVVTEFTNAVNTEYSDLQTIARNAVNNATEETMRSVLEENAVLLGLELDDYENLIEATKDVVAQTVFENKTYANVGEVKSAFDAAVENAAVVAVNGSEDVAELKLAIENHIQALGLNPVYSEAEADEIQGVETGDPKPENEYVYYVQLADQDVVIEALFELLEDNDFDNATAIKTAFDEAVQAQNAEEAVAAINAVENGEIADMRAALEVDFNAKGLDISVSRGSAYSTLTSSGKNAIAEIVLTKMPEGGYEDTDDNTAAELIKADFEAAVSSIATSLPVVALTSVQEAATRTQMRDALTQHQEVIGIDLNDQFNALATAGQNDVLDAMIAETLAAVSDIETEFNLFVAIQAVNEADDAASMKDVLENEVNVAALGFASGKVDSYEDLSETRQLAVAQHVLDVRDDEDVQADFEGEFSFTERAAIDTAFEAGVDAQLAEIAAADALVSLNDFTPADPENISAADRTTIQDILESGDPDGSNLGLTDLIAEYTAHKDVIANAVIAELSNSGDITLAKLQEVFKLALGVEVINDAANGGDLKVAIDEHGAAVGLAVGNDTMYANLTDKEAVGTVLYNEIDVEGAFADAGAIIEAFDAAVLEQQAEEAVDAINAAKSSATTMRGHLNNSFYVEALDLPTVTGTANQVRLANVISADATDAEYSNAAEVKAAVEAAIAINTASTTTQLIAISADAELRGAIERAGGRDTKLLDLITAFNALDEDDFEDILDAVDYEEAVAEAILAFRNSNAGEFNSFDSFAKKSEEIFNAYIAVVEGIHGVNEAATAVAMEAAIVALDIDFGLEIGEAADGEDPATGWYALSAFEKEVVVLELIDARNAKSDEADEQIFLTVEEIQAALDQIKAEL